MIFLDQTKKVVFIARNTVPYSLETIRAPMKVRYVLELNADSADKYGINIGDILK